MAKKITYICDNCKKEFESEDSIYTTQIPTMKQMVARGGISNCVLAMGEPYLSYEDNELCKQCLVKFQSAKIYTDEILAKYWEQIKSK